MKTIILYELDFKMESKHVWDAMLRDFKLPWNTTQIELTVGEAVSLTNKGVSK